MFLCCYIYFELAKMTTFVTSIDPSSFIFSPQNEDGTKVEYRVWNPFRSKLAAAILGGVDDVWIVSLCFLFLPFVLYLS